MRWKVYFCLANNDAESVMCCYANLCTCVYGAPLLSFFF